ncbi:hypothetical protein [Mucilaginibacter sp. L196]|uniref:hypothetical protein n=1 Tax=Mucilaginibacter sp. L196 TaxID=1641870 RepID=UPI00131D806A|nr:hypothetical protein [Mucilaginibacter sp. L196]
MKDSIKYLVASSKIGFLICLFLLIGEVAHAQETWLGVTGIAQYNSTTNAYRWNFGTNGLFSPYDLFLNKADSLTTVTSDYVTQGLFRNFLNGNGFIANNSNINTPQTANFNITGEGLFLAGNGTGVSVKSGIGGGNLAEVDIYNSSGTVSSYYRNASLGFADFTEHTPGVFGWQMTYNTTTGATDFTGRTHFKDSVTTNQLPVNPYDVVNKAYIDSLFNSSGPSSTLITREAPSGVQNGINEVFTLVNIPIIGSESVFLNGVLQDEGVGEDYTISGSTITFLSTIQPTDKIRVNYSIIY